MFILHRDDVLVQSRHFECLAELNNSVARQIYDILQNQKNVPMTKIDAGNKLKIVTAAILKSV